MARPGPWRKAGNRYPCGQLKPVLDYGTDELQARRAEDSNGNGRDPRSGYPLGCLLLRNAITEAQHAAGLRYAALHFRVWGPLSIRSNVADLVTRGLVTPGSQFVDAVFKAHKPAEAALASANDALGSDRSVVIATAVFEQMALSTALPQLRRDLDALHQHFEEVTKGKYEQAADLGSCHS